MDKVRGPKIRLKTAGKQNEHTAIHLRSYITLNGLGVMLFVVCGPRVACGAVPCSSDGGQGEATLM
jgi:hypothetical protein